MRPEEKVISSIKHPAVVAARQGLGQIGRHGRSSFLVDGYKLVSQALESRARSESLFFLHPVEGEAHAALLQHAFDMEVECHLVTKGVFFRILGLGYETSVQVLAAVSRPQSADATAFLDGDACLLVGERIQDPRNVGVLIRTADGWGLPGAIFSGDSADPYSRASVRSSTGSIFRLRLTLTDNLVACLEKLKAMSVRIIGTSAHAKKACWDVDLSARSAIVFGNETTGLSDDVKKACDELVTIPMRGRAHSFNVTVAAGIILYQRARQLHPKC